MESNSSFKRIAARPHFKLIGLVILLILSLIAATFGVIETVRSVQGLQVMHQRVTSGDVSTVRPWMTLPYIAHVYNVPESALEKSLHITDDPQRLHHVSLQTLADRAHRSVDELIHEVQQAILTYRRQHHAQPAPSPIGNRQRVIPLPLAGGVLC